MAYFRMYGNNIIVPTVKIYGAEWAGTSDPAWTRTDDAVGLSDPNPAVNNGNGNSPFDTIMPWAGMKRVEDSAAGTLVEIPKFYYKWTRDGIKMKLQISALPVDGFLVSPAHADRGDGKGERDVVYVGAYHCATSTYKSTTGVKPQISKTRATFRSSIHNLGSDIWQYDYAMHWTIAMLYLVEYANWNVQTAIAVGCGNGSAIEVEGQCDGMIYHTGTSASSKTSYGATRYRYIEGLWSNCTHAVDGIYTKQNNIYCIKNPANFSDSDNGTFIGTSHVSKGANGVITSWTNPTTVGFEYALYPDAISTDNTYSTYVCDGYYAPSNAWFNNASLICGGNYSRNQGLGLFFLYADTGYNSAGSSIGSRLMKLP